MKRTLLLTLSAIALCIPSSAQQKDEAEKLVEEGIAYHDKGDYEGAIARYDKALQLDKNNLLALVEKSMTLMSLRKYDEAIDLSKLALKEYPGNKLLSHVYVTYGTALDALKKTDKSIEVYEEGLKLFPYEYQLYYNKGITLSSVKKYDEALLSFQQAAVINPKHASSHNAIARMQNIKGNRIPALLAYSRFMSLEPQSPRAKENLGQMLQLLGQHVEKKDDKNISINLPMGLVDDDKSKKPTENDFRTTELIVTMTAALDHTAENKDKTPPQLFLLKFETLCSSLKESEKGSTGFYWKYYAPYFIALQDKGHQEAFAHIVFASGEDAAVMKWIEEHDAAIKAFFKWSKEYVWKSE